MNIHTADSSKSQVCFFKVHFFETLSVILLSCPSSGLQIIFYQQNVCSANSYALCSMSGSCLIFKEFFITFMHLGAQIP